MNLKKLKKLIDKGIRGSAEKQLKVFMKNKKTRKTFEEAISWNIK